VSAEERTQPRRQRTLAFVSDFSNKVQAAGLSEFGGALPSPNAFFSLVSCDGFSPERPDQNENWAAFCDPGIDEEIARAQET